MAYVSEGGIYSGDLYLDRYDANGNRTGERQVGNTKNLTFEAPKIEKKERIGKMIANYGQTIDSVITKNTQSLKFTLDDINKKNLALALFGEDTVVTVGSGSVTDEAVTARHDLSVKLTKRKIKTSPAPVVTDDAGAVTYTAGTDYEIDYNAGMIKVLSTGIITDGQALKADYSYDAYTGYKVQANKVTKIDVFVRLIGKNVVSNDDVEVIAYKASLEPSGAIDFITEDYANLEFSGEIQATADGTWDVMVLAG